MDRDRLEHLLRDLRQSRRGVWQFIMIVVGLALILSITANMLSNYLWLAATLSTQLVLLVLSLLFGILLTLKSIDLLYAGEKIQSRDIRLVLPLHVTPGAVKIEKIGGYSLTDTAQLVLGMAYSKDLQGRDQFLSEWRSMRERHEVPYQGIVYQHLHDLVQFLLLKYLGEHGEVTLGRSAAYKGFAVGVALEEYKVENLPAGLARNYFLKNVGTLVKKSIRLPQGSCFLAIPSPESASGVDPQADISLRLKYGQITLQVKPYWTRADEKSRTGCIIERYVTGRTRHSEVWGVIIQIRLVPSFKGFNLLFSRDFEQFYIWTAHLFSFLEQKLDWEHYVQGDLERMIVDIRNQLEELYKTLIEKQG